MHKVLLISMCAVPSFIYAQGQLQQVNCPNPYTPNQIILVQSVKVNPFSNSPAVIVGCYQLDTSFTINNSTTPPTITISPGIISGGTVVNFADEEVLTGTINGTNLTFTTINTPIDGTVKLFKNGLRLKRGVDFTITGNTVTMFYMVEIGSLLVCDYRY